MVKEIDKVTGVETTGHVWDDDLQRAEQAFAQMVAVHALCIDHLGDRILDCLSGLAVDE